MHLPHLALTLCLSLSLTQSPPLTLTLSLSPILTFTLALPES